MPKSRTTKTAAERLPLAQRIAYGHGQRLMAEKSHGAIPPPSGAPLAQFPVAVSEVADALAPSPIVDKFPWVIGQNLDATYISSIFRLATTGYRQQYVDLLRELVEQDAHLFSVLTKRFTSVSNGRFEITSAIDAPDHPEFEDAKEICELVNAQWSAIPDLTQSVYTLLWGVYYGASALENMWDVRGKEWTLKRFNFVHSRRISWPDGQSFRAHIWDQGQVYGWTAPFEAPTNRSLFGLALADWPGKFVLYTPQLTADYPTREGVGRETAIWALFKRIGGRGAASYLERFAKGFMDVSCRTALMDADGKDSGHPREATPEDIKLANRIAASIGAGSGSYAVHPDSIAITPQSFDGGSSAKITWQEWIGICDSQMSKAVLGGTLGTEVGKGGGNRALGEVQERGEVDLEQLDASTVAEAFRHQTVWWIVHLNRRGKEHLCPKVALHIDVEPDAKSLLENALAMTKIGGPVDLDALSGDTGIKLIENKSGKPRRSFLSFTLDPSLVDDSLMSDEAKAQVEEANKSKQAIELAKAQAPKVAPPGTAAAPAAKANSKAKPKSSPAKADKKMGEDRLAFLLTAKREDRVATRAVYEELLEDYPPGSLEWILAAHWEGPTLVDLSRIDFSKRQTWRASHEDITPYVKRLQKALRGDGERKPVILVKTPGNDLLLIVDGHHRTLSAEEVGVPVLAYIAEVYVDDGPWSRLHGAQKSGTSRGPSIEPNSSYIYEEEGEDHDDEQHGEGATE